MGVASVIRGSGALSTGSGSVARSLVATLIHSSGPGIGFPAGTTPAC